MARRAKETGAFIASWKVSPGGPPAILFFGARDPLLEKARDFARELIAAGTRAGLYTAAGQAHGFFNDRPGSPWRALALRRTDLFLASLGYLEGAATLAMPSGGKAAPARTQP